MSSKYNSIQSRPGVNRVTVTGAIVINGKQDADEYGLRQADWGLTSIDDVVMIYGYELAFTRIGKQPNRIALMGHTEDHILVWTSWNGATHEDESAFRMVGVTRNTAQHQGNQGQKLSGGLALHIGGSNTVLCRSTMPISIGARLMWAIPRSPHLAIDSTGHGRMLTEIRELDMRAIPTNPLQMHSAARANLFGINKGGMGKQEKSKYQHAVNFVDTLMVIACGLHIAALETRGPVTDREKMNAAVLFGVVGAKASNSVALMRMKEGVDKFKAHSIDLIFQMRYNARARTSHATKELTTFPLNRRGVPVKDPRTQEFAQKQVTQAPNLIGTIISVYDATMQRVFGWTPSGGFPGHDFDVIFNRL